MSTMKPPSRYRQAMIGTIFSVTEAMRCTPPMKMKAAMAHTIRPMTQLGMWNAFWHASPMELDCTIEPMKPSARMIATAKKPARNLPKPFGKARLM